MRKRNMRNSRLFGRLYSRIVLYATDSNPIVESNMARITLNPVAVIVIALMHWQLLLASDAAAQLTAPPNPSTEKVAVDPLGRETPRLG